MTPLQQRIFWWLMIISPLRIGFFWWILIILYQAWGIDNDIHLLINRILWFVPLVTVPLWIYRLRQWYKHKEHFTRVVLSKPLEPYVYEQDFNITRLTSVDVASIQKHNLWGSLSPWLSVFFYLITFWIFGIFYYGFKHEDFPILKENDIWSGQAIWWMLIPVFNIYWRFIFRWKLIRRINLQYKVRKWNKPLSEDFITIVLVLWLIPWLNILIFLTLFPIIIYQVQNAINQLVHDNKTIPSIS